MSIALAMSKIGFYSGKYDTYTEEVNKLQTQVMTITAGGVAGPAAALIRQSLARYMALQGLAKEFLDYWKDVAKQFMSMLKSLTELSQGAR